MQLVEKTNKVQTLVFHSYSIRSGFGAANEVSHLNEFHAILPNYNNVGFIQISTWFLNSPYQFMDTLLYCNIYGVKICLHEKCKSCDSNRSSRIWNTKEYLLKQVIGVLASPCWHSCVFYYTFHTYDTIGLKYGRQEEGRIGQIGINFPYFVKHSFTRAGDNYPQPGMC